MNRFFLTVQNLLDLETNGVLKLKYDTGVEIWSLADIPYVSIFRFKDLRADSLKNWTVQLKFRQNLP